MQGCILRYGLYLSSQRYELEYWLKCEVAYTNNIIWHSRYVLMTSSLANILCRTSDVYVVQLREEKRTFKCGKCYHWRITAKNACMSSSCSVRFKLAQNKLRLLMFLHTNYYAMRVSFNPPVFNLGLFNNRGCWYNIVDNATRLSKL